MKEAAWVQPESVELGLVSPVLAFIGMYGLLFTPNPLETAWAMLMLWLLLRWFWWKNFPPILVYGTIMPWIEVHTALFQSNLYGETLNESFEGTGQATYWMASIGFFAVILGLRWGLARSWRSLIPSFEEIEAAVAKLDQTRIFIALGIARLFALGMDSAISFRSSLYQFVTYSYGVGDVISVILYIHFFMTRQRPALFFAFFGFELASSFYSYFGEWKGPIILLFLAALVQVQRVSPRVVFRVGPIFIATFYLVFIWQSVKGQYRAFLDQRTSDRFSQQVVKVDQGEALAKFWELAIEANSSSEEDRESVLKSTLSRVGYLEFFSKTVARIPEKMPHEDGGLLKENLTFALIPRFLNPNKGVKNDRLRTEEYSGVYLGGIDASASFSLSHYCEAFIDWGPNRMMLQLLIYGMLGAVLWGAARRRYSTMNILMLIGMWWVVLKPWGTMQKDMIEISGTLFWGAFCHLLLFSPLYRFLERFIHIEGKA